MKYYYFEKLPLYELFPPAITKEDPRLEDPFHFKHKFESWKSLFKEDIFENMKVHGQIDPNIACWENNRWRIEPGQARWLAMHYLGFKTQKVILCVNPEKDPDHSHFLQFPHKEVAEEELPSLFQHVAEHRGYDYIYRRWIRKRNEKSL